MEREELRAKTVQSSEASATWLYWGQFSSGDNVIAACEMLCNIFGYVLQV